jgi:L-seryl-tRNA(Ser) seleniumtransferase
MIEKIANQSFTGYEGRRIRGIGRPMKVDRQEIIGVTVAVHEWVTMNHEERLAFAEQQSSVMLAPLQNIAGVKAEIIDNIIGNQPFGVKVEIDEKITGISAEQLVEKLKSLDTPIWTRNGTNHEENTIKLVPWALNTGEDKIVGENIAKLLK